jgi:hypothetical protein
VATRFFQDLVVSSGKKCISLQDPDQIFQRSGAETSKIFPRVVFYLIFREKRCFEKIVKISLSDEKILKKIFLSIFSLGNRLEV